MISEAARQTGVEAHVLRFWEEELELEIPRNEQGHRYYTEEQIAIFERVKTMKLQGLQLKAIKDNLMQQEEPRESVVTTVEEPETQLSAIGISHSDKLVEFESIVYDIVTEALRNNNDRQVKDISDRVGDKVVKEMNYLMRENEEHLEEHFRKLDEALMKRSRKNRARSANEAAATKVTQLPVVSQSKKKHRLFPRKRKTTLY